MFKIDLKPQEHLHTRFGNVSINKTDGYYRVTTSKQGNHSKRWHRLIFEDFYGPIPKGYIVHHKDGNKLNNCLMNLEILKQSTHRTNHYLNSDENTTGYYRVSKWKSKSYKRGYCWVYQARKYNEGNIKRDLIIKPTLKELEEEVKRQGFEWKEL